MGSGGSPVGSSLGVPSQRLIVPALLLLAAIPRLLGLGAPNQLMFDEAHYARDACVYVSSDGCGVDRAENDEHPPLGKWMISLGIVMFGNEAFGWRIASALAGTASVLLLYLLGMQLTASVRTSFLAAALLALDPLHFVMSRIAMLDIFVPAFGLTALVGAMKVRRGSPSPQLWVFAVGVASGAAIATKWSGVVFMLLALVILGRSINTAAVVVGVAGAVYALSFIGQVGSVSEFLARQWDMWSFHTELSYRHPYTSPPWTWLTLKRPVAFFFGILDDGRYVEVLATGNPFVWGGAFLALGAAAWAWIEARAEAIERLAVAGFAATFGLWLVFSVSRTAMFLFYMTSVLPFMYLALARAVARVRWRTVAAVASAALFFAFYLPIMTAGPLTEDQWDGRIIAEDCLPPSADESTFEMPRPLVRATPGGAPPPDGWCWI